MTTPQTRNPDYAARVRDSFGRQAFMATIGAELTDVAPGHVEMRLPYRPELGQQHGFFHGGVIGTLADNAGGYAAFTLMSPEDSILTVEYKMNIVSPGRGDALVAVGTVLKPGRTLTVCEVKVYAETAGERKLCATAICTLMTMKDMSDDKAV
ncbi:MAG: PaaI family thioesterase [Alphaproteobacteria bacterium]